MFPNPTAGILVIKGNNIEPLKIYSAGGKQIFLTNAINTGNNYTTINLGNLPNGIYYISINGKIQKVVKK